MPNIFVQRYVILGNRKIIDRVMKDHFYIANQKNFPYRQGSLPMWLSKGLMDDDPMLEQIVNSGDFVREKDKISFSSYMGYDMHYHLIENMARKLPKGTILLVIGFDMDDFPSATGGQIAEIEGYTGRQIRYETYPSQWIAKHHFPLLFNQLEEENNST